MVSYGISLLQMNGNSVKSFIWLTGKQYIIIYLFATNTC